MKTLRLIFLGWGSLACAAASLPACGDQSGQAESSYDSVSSPLADAWASGVSYSVGDSVWDGSGTYTCVQAHTSQVGWEPSAAPALWSLQGDSSDWTAWVTYPVGALVTHGGKTYRAVQGHTAQPGWEPPAVPALWEIVEEDPGCPFDDSEHVGRPDGRPSMAHLIVAPDVGTAPHLYPPPDPSKATPIPRRAIIVEPAAESGPGPHPVLLYQGGYGSRAADLHWFQFETFFPEAYVIYTEGADGWSYDGRPEFTWRYPWQNDAPFNLTFEANYFDWVMSELKTRFPGDVDLDRVFGGGFSNGSFVTLSAAFLQDQADVFDEFEFRAVAGVGSYVRWWVDNPTQSTDWTMLHTSDPSDWTRGSSPIPILYTFGHDDDDWPNGQDLGLPAWHPVEDSLASSSVEQLSFFNNTVAPSPDFRASTQCQRIRASDPSGADLYVRFYAGGHSHDAWVSAMWVNFFRSLE